MALGDAVNYVLGSLDKPGRAVRGVLGGNLHEGLAAIPFSDSLGITNPKDEVTPRALSDRLGLTRPGDTGWGGTIGSFATGMAADPLNWIPAGVAGKAAARAFGGTTLGRSMAESRLGRFAGDESGALGLKFDDFAEPPKGMSRNDPEWVNNRTFYHGGATPFLEANQLDPRKTALENLFGRGVYTTDNPEIAMSYMDKGMDGAQMKGPPQNIVDLLVRDASEGRFDGDVSRFREKPAGSLTPTDRMVWLHAHEGGIPSFLTVQQMSRPHQDSIGNWLRERLGEFQPDLSQPVVHQMQSNYGNILDLDKPMREREIQKLRSSMVDSILSHQARFGDSSHPAGWLRNPSDELITQAKNPGELLSSALEGAEEMGYPHEDPFVLRGLRNAGYDALTHTGGLRYSPGKNLTHQVVIGLDPNDTLKMGKASPYQRWEQYLMGRY